MHGSVCLGNWDKGSFFHVTLLPSQELEELNELLLTKVYDRDRNIIGEACSSLLLVLEKAVMRHGKKHPGNRDEGSYTMSQASDQFLATSHHCLLKN